MEDEKELIRQIAGLRSVIEGSFIALIAYQLHAADRARGIDHCLRTAAQLVRDGASLSLGES
jgi:hypothetical protein